MGLSKEEWQGPLLAVSGRADMVGILDEALLRFVIRDRLLENLQSPICFTCNYGEDPRLLRQIWDW